MCTLVAAYTGQDLAVREGQGWGKERKIHKEEGVFDLDNNN